MRQYDSYFEYERDLGRGVVAAFLGEQRLSIDGKRLLDIGCGEGGVLAGLAERYSFHGLGLDYDEEMVRRAKKIPNCTIAHGDFYSYSFSDKYDFILIRDVLEHCGDPVGMLRKAASLLAAKGYVYVTYTPFLSPFGGHQHNGSGLLSNVPYLQALPEALFLKLISPSSNIYKGGDHLLRDLRQIRKTWLTTGKVIHAARKAGLSIAMARGWFVRPDYRYKFGLKPISFPRRFPVHTITDVVCTSVEMLLQPHDQEPRS
jgi:SAM-dependent methyltransferase